MQELKKSLKCFSFGTRYKDGEYLSGEDEEAEVEKLLAYHPQSEDKIGCGLHFVMVNAPFLPCVLLVSILDLSLRFILAF